MDKAMRAVKKTNNKVVNSAKRGAKQAVGMEAKTLLVEQVRKLLGEHFPDNFYGTPIGKAVLDMGACYLVSMAAEMFPTMPGAQTVSEFSEHAMTGVAQESFTPLVGMAQELFTNLAAQAALVTSVAEDEEA